VARPHFELVPLSGAIGAEVTGLDLTTPLAPEVRDELYAAWLRHQVLFVRDQDLDETELRRFAGYFGAPEHAQVQQLRFGSVPGAPLPTVLHIDASHLRTPDKGALLYACKVPQAGGDTIWVNGYAAFAALSPSIQRLCEELTLVHPIWPRAYVETFVAGGPEALRAASAVIDRMTAPAEHSLVCQHPETGQRSLFIDPMHTWSIKELTAEESRVLIDLLCRHVCNPDFQCRFKWYPGSLAVYDNRCTLHRVVNDVKDAPRVHFRVGLGREPRPFENESSHLGKPT
jgi:taurine dioxygenase